MSYFSFFFRKNKSSHNYLHIKEPNNICKMNQDSKNFNYNINGDRIKRSHTFNVPTQINKSVHLNPQRTTKTATPQFIKSPYDQANKLSPINKQHAVKTSPKNPQIKRHNTSPNLKVNDTLIRSKSIAQNPNNMKKYDININIKDFDIKSMNDQNLTSTYAQQQQYSQNYSAMFGNNYKSFIFYGPNKQKDLIYVGQNPVLKNYFKLRRIKYDELIENLNKGDPLGYNTNVETNDTVKKQDDGDGFIKVNVSGNIRLDNPENYKQTMQQQNIAAEKVHEQEDKKVSLKKKMFGLFKPKPTIDHKRTGNDNMKVAPVRKGYEEKSNNVVNHPYGQQQAYNNESMSQQKLNKPSQQPAFNKSLPQHPPQNRMMLQQLPVHNRPLQQHPMPNRVNPHQTYGQHRPGNSIQPINTTGYHNADKNYTPMQHFNSNGHNPNYNSDAPKLQNEARLYQASSGNRNSIKDVDMLLDVALKTYDVSDFNNKTVKSNLSPYASNSLSTSPTKSDSWGTLLNAKKMIHSESNDDDLDFLELYSPLDIKMGGNRSRRISICSTNSENSVMSKNSYRNLSFTNLEKLKVMMKMNEGVYSIKNEDNKNVQFEDPVLDRLFEGGFKKIKVFDKVRQKWVIYKDTNKSKDKLMPKKDGIQFSQSVEVFPLPPLAQDSDTESDDSMDSIDRDNFSDLSEEELMKLKSMKEMKMFQEIKTEVNNYKSQEMLVHKDSILYTHFFI